MSEFQKKLGSQERRAGISLAIIYAFRMLGLFMILPVFAIYAESLPDNTPLLTGVALGIYGLTQALLQIPFGRLSDKIGRKPVIAIGLLIFAAGSLLAASADGIYGIIAGRALQGAGAIAAALMALAADLSTEEHRTRMMALIGVSIGASFAVSMTLGPLVNDFIGVSGIFASTAGLAILGIGILYLFVPNPIVSQFHRDTEVDAASIGSVLKTPDLLRLDIGIFVLHFVLMAVFLVVPLVLRDNTGLGEGNHWQLYVPVFIAALILMLPFIILAEKKHQIKLVYVGAIATLALAVVGFMQSHALWAMAITLVLFFSATSLLEALLPSLVTKTAHATHKGTAMGVYSTSQFLGTFCGGVAGGAAHDIWGLQGVFLVALFAIALWFVVALFMQKPRHLSTYLLKVGEVHETELLAVAGVVEAAVIKEEGVAYLKVDKQLLDEEKLVTFAVHNS